MPKPQKRFTKKFEIEGEINRLRRRATASTQKGNEINDLVKSKIIEANNPVLKPHERQFLVEQADELRKKSAKAYRTAELIYDKHLPQLGRTLAAFKTETLFKGDDTAVVIQK